MLIRVRFSEPAVSLNMHNIGIFLVNGIESVSPCARAVVFGILIDSVARLYEAILNRGSVFYKA